MDANNFVSALKAEGTGSDRCDLANVFDEYRMILSNLAARDRGNFSLNILCTLCRNLDKVPSWSAAVDTGALLTLSIECLRQTRTLNRPELVKALACLYHLHKYAVKQNSKTSSTLILKISYMAFETDVEHLLSEYVKTYWNILADRLLYIEKLKAQKCVIANLLPKLQEDVEKVLKMYDTVQFCSNILVFLVKKLYSLFGEASSMELNKFYLKIFEVMTEKNDLRNFKKLSEKDMLDLYVKFSECLYIIAENSSKIHFKDCHLTKIVRYGILLFVHSPGIFHCLQTFYSNFFCVLLAEKQFLSHNETLLNSVISSCETTEKLGYRKAMECTYPYLNQFLRVFIEYIVDNYDKKKWLDSFSDDVQNGCLNFILFLMKKLKNCNQLLKCENCEIKTGLHDALRLSFLTKSLITFNLVQEIDVSEVLSSFHAIVEEQYSVLKSLRILGCVNYEKCYRKLQTDIHNLAIYLNKSKYYEISLKLFDVYLKNEIVSFKTEADLKNIARALYNKSICQIDAGISDKALTDAYLSLVFSYPESLNSEKYMSLVMDVKAKTLKAFENLNEEDNSEEDRKTQEEKDANIRKDTKIKEEKDTKIQDKLQLVTSLDVCENCLEHEVYGNLKPFFCALKFSELLKHEFKMYVKLWPSVVPIAGVWRSLHRLCGAKLKWITVPDTEIKSTLYEVVIETPNAVKSIHSEYFKEVIEEILRDFGVNPYAPESQMIYATLLFMKSEFDLNDASLKYGWKTAEPNTDPDLVQVTRTAAQEFEAVRCAIEATAVWTAVVKRLEEVPRTDLLTHALQMMKIYSLRFLNLSLEPHGLQLAHLCCAVSSYIGDRHTYIQFASIIIYHAPKKIKDVDALIRSCSKFWDELLKVPQSMDVALNYICESALYYYKCGQIGLAAKVTRIAQAHILNAVEKYPDVKLDMAIGRLMEVQSYVCEDAQTTLSAVNGVQRHYLSVVKEGKDHVSRAESSLQQLSRAARASALGASVTRATLQWRRARASAAVTLPRCAALHQARLFASITNTHSVEDAQTKIDNRLKYILGVSTTTDTQTTTSQTLSKSIQFTPKPELETMLENMTFKKTQASPSVPCLSVPGFKKPDFVTHDSSCHCYACQNPICHILSCQTSGLEASMYFRAKEFAIARNYFHGVLNMFEIVESKVLSILKNYRTVFEGYLIDIVEETCFNDFKRIQIEILIEAAFFELSQGNCKSADEFVVQIHEITQESSKIDKYLENEILNLMLSCAKVKSCAEKTKKAETEKKATETGLEAEMDSLKLSPEKELPPQKTPDVKVKKLPKAPKIVVKDDEVPKTKRRAIKLNLDDASDTVNDKNSVKKTKAKKSGFKVPIPITTKPALEAMTPTPRKASATVMKPNCDNILTPKPKSEAEFFTPLQTPNDQFFTPMTSLKTYSKRSLRHNIVKNLEAEFSTPKVGKENLNKNIRAQEENADETCDDIEEKVVDNAKSKSKISIRSVNTNVENNTWEENTTGTVKEKSTIKTTSILSTAKEKTIEYTSNIPNREKALVTESTSSTRAREKTSTEKTVSKIPKMIHKTESPKENMTERVVVSQKSVSDTNLVSGSSKTKSNVESSRKMPKEKNTLKRLTSPAKVSDEKPVRSSRLRKPVSRLSSEQE